MSTGLGISAAKLPIGASATWRSAAICSGTGSGGPSAFAGTAMVKIMQAATLAATCFIVGTIGLSVGILRLMKAPVLKEYHVVAPPDVDELERVLHRIGSCSSSRCIAGHQGGGKSDIPFVDAVLGDELCIEPRASLKQCMSKPPFPQLD